MTGRIFEQMIRERAGAVIDPGRAKITSLTAKERELVALAAHHLSTTIKGLARMPGLSEHTVRNRLTSIYEKLNVSGRIAMFAFAYKHGLNLVPVEGTDLSSRPMHDAVRDLGIREPINSEKCSETADAD